MFERGTDRDRMPLPSEDGGDRAAEPPSGETEDYMVAEEEGVPYIPPTERVIGTPGDDGSVESAAAPADDAEALEAGGAITGRNARRDDALLADVLAALRASDLPAGDRIRLGVSGTTIIVRGEVESIDVGEEILALVGEVPGVEDVVDELEVAGI